MNQDTINLNMNILKAHANNDKQQVKENLKVLLSKMPSELTKNKDFKPSINLIYKLQPIDKNIVNIEMKDLIDNTFNIFFKFNNLFTDEQTKQLKYELLQLPIKESYSVIFKYEDTYLDIVIYNILNFIKDTRYIINNIPKKQRYYHSRFKIDVLQKRLLDIDNIKTNNFLLPKSNYDLKLLDTKEKLLKKFDEDYNIIFAFAHLYSIQPIQNMLKDKIFDDTIKDFIDFVNNISTTNKEAIKSLAILIFKLFKDKCKNDELEYSIQNILRIFFEDEIVSLNKNKQNFDNELDTFIVNAKVLSKNAYIHSSFDNIPIYGTHKENKYFFYKNIKVKEFMKTYFNLSSQINNTKIPLSTYRRIKLQFKNPQLFSYYKQYPEFFKNQDINLNNIMDTFLSEMKKTAPDTLK